MTGTIIQVNVSRGGLPKRPIESGIVTPLGIEGDCCAHPKIHGGPMQAVLLITAETIDELAQRGYPVSYGSLGENLTVRGIDRRFLRSGQTFLAGTARIELTKLRTPCSALDVYGPDLQRELFDKAVKQGDFSSPRWGMSGFYARVVTPGFVKAGDIMALEAVSA
ncbi:MAG: MOSC domain-containing protein [Bryobacterales bacterium]|nr:MOSC domain-containing protein [Bryobacterales bacterium]